MLNREQIMGSMPTTQVRPFEHGGTTIWSADERHILGLESRAIQIPSVGIVTTEVRPFERQAIDALAHIIRKSPPQILTAEEKIEPYDPDTHTENNFYRLSVRGRAIPKFVAGLIHPRLVVGDQQIESAIYFPTIAENIVYSLSRQLDLTDPLYTWPDIYLEPAQELLEKLTVAI